MTIKDIGKFEWERNNEWLEKWYNTELSFRAFDKKVNPLLKLFTHHGLMALALNTRWFFEKKTSILWDKGKEGAAKNGWQILTDFVSKSKDYISKAEKILHAFERKKTFNVTVLSEIKKGFLFLWFVFLVDLGEYLGHVIDERLKFKNLTKKQIEEIKNYYFSSPKPLTFQKEGEDLKRIVRIYKKQYGKKIFAYRDLPEEIHRLLIKHKKQFEWITTIDLNLEPFSLKDYYASLKQMLILELKSNVRKHLDKEIKKSLGKEDVEFLELVNRHLFLDNYAADVCAKLDFLMSKLLSKHFGISFSELSWYSFQELETLVEKGIKLNKKDLKERKQYRVMVQLDGDLGYFYGKDNFDKIKSLVHDNISFAKITKIKGIISSIGVAEGKVKVVKSKKDMSKVKVGDILVAPSTHPDLMPAIRHSAAVVTDTGGITSHAAIISRELGIPCIVGAKNATEILKDGDLVEVDANKGVVTILKN